MSYNADQGDNFEPPAGLTHQSGKSGEGGKKKKIGSKRKCQTTMLCVIGKRTTIHGGQWNTNNIMANIIIISRFVQILYCNNYMQVRSHGVLHLLWERALLWQCLGSPLLWWGERHHSHQHYKLHYWMLILGGREDAFGRIGWILKAWS